MQQRSQAHLDWQCGLQPQQHKLQHQRLVQAWGCSHAECPQQKRGVAVLGTEQPTADEAAAAGGCGPCPASVLAQRLAHQSCLRVF